MKASFKPLSLADRGVCCGSGLRGNSQCIRQPWHGGRPYSGLGDLAIVPYYTVQRRLDHRCVGNQHQC